MRGSASAIARTLVELVEPGADRQHRADPGGARRARSPHRARRRNRENRDGSGCRRASSIHAPFGCRGKRRVPRRYSAAAPIAKNAPRIVCLRSRLSPSARAKRLRDVVAQVRPSARPAAQPVERPPSRPRACRYLARWPPRGGRGTGPAGPRRRDKCPRHPAARAGRRRHAARRDRARAPRSIRPSVVR